MHSRREGGGNVCYPIYVLLCRLGGDVSIIHHPDPEGADA